MSFLIVLSNGNVLTTVNDYTVNNSSSLSLPGQGYPNFGQFLLNDLIHHLENFSNNTAPTNPIQGQLWWNSTAQTMMVWNSTAWANISQSQPPFFTATGIPTYGDGTNSTTSPNSEYTFYGSNNTNNQGLIIAGPNGLIISQQNFSQAGSQSGMTNFVNTTDILKLSQQGIIIPNNIISNASLGTHVSLAMSGAIYFAPNTNETQLSLSNLNNLSDGVVSYVIDNNYGIAPGGLAYIDTTGTPRLIQETIYYSASDKPSFSDYNLWQPNATYTVGEAVIYNGSLYDCTTLNTAGTFSNSFWSIQTVVLDSPNSQNTFYGSDNQNMNGLIITGPNGLTIQAQSFGTFSNTTAVSGLVDYTGLLPVIEIENGNMILYGEETSILQVTSGTISLNQAGGPLVFGVSNGNLNLNSTGAPVLTISPGSLTLSNSGPPIFEVSGNGVEFFDNNTTPYLTISSNTFLSTSNQVQFQVGGSYGAFVVMNQGGVGSVPASINSVEFSMGGSVEFANSGNVQFDNTGTLIVNSNSNSEIGSYSSTNVGVAINTNVFLSGQMRLNGALGINTDPNPNGLGIAGNIIATGQIIAANSSFESSTIGGTLTVSQIIVGNTLAYNTLALYDTSANDVYGMGIQSGQMIFTIPSETYSFGFGAFDGTTYTGMVSITGGGAVFTVGIDNTPVGLNIASTGNFTTLNATGIFTGTTGSFSGALVGNTASFSGGVTTGSLVAASLDNTPIGLNIASTGNFTDVSASVGSFVSLTINGATPITANGGTLTGPLVGTTITASVGSFSASVISNNVQLNSSTGPYWASGSGIPTYTAAIGSIYSRSDGTIGAIMYVSAGAGTWNAIAGV